MLARGLPCPSIKLGRGALTGIGEGVYSLLLGRVPSPPPSSTPQLVLNGLFAAIVMIQAAGMARSVVLLRRWQALLRAG
jgi:hypothetical protein